jgi:hypothetical protein
LAIENEIIDVADGSHQQRCARLGR